MDTFNYKEYVVNAIIIVRHVQELLIFVYHAVQDYFYKQVNAFLNAELIIIWQLFHLLSAYNAIQIVYHVQVLQ